MNASYRLGLPVLDELGELEEDLRRGGTELWLVGVHASARAQLEADPLATRLGAGGSGMTSPPRRTTSPKARGRIIDRRER